MGTPPAVTKARKAPDVDLPDVVAQELTHAALVLDDARGEMLILPFAGEAIAYVTLMMSGVQCSVTYIPRDDDVGNAHGGLPPHQRYRGLGHDGAIVNALRRAP